MKKRDLTGVQPDSYIYTYANEDMKCDGCGEAPITKGDLILKSTNSAGSEVHYCVRCIFAIDYKLRYRPDHTAIIENGSLKWHRLANAFKKRFFKFCEEIEEANQNDDQNARDEATKAFYNDMGIEQNEFLLKPNSAPVDVRKVRKKEYDHQRYLRKREEQMKKEREEIKRLAQENISLREMVTNKATELVKHFLAAKVAHLKHDNVKYQDEHAASAEIVLELQRLTDVTA